MTTEKITTPPFRVSFPSVFKPSAVPGTDSDPKYSVVMMFPKDSKKTGPFVKKVKALLKAEKAEKWASKAPKKLRLCLTDGDSEDELEASDGTTEGFYLIKGSSNSKPGVILRDGSDALPDEFYPGCWSIATVVFRAYDKGSNGIACHFNNFMKWEDDERFGESKKEAADDFADYLGGDDDDDDDDDESGEDLDI